MDDDFFLDGAVPAELWMARQFVDSVHRVGSPDAAEVFNFLANRIAIGLGGLEMRIRRLEERAGIDSGPVLP